MDIIRLIGVAIIEYPQYLLSSKYDYSRFWNKCIRINTLYTKVLQAIAVNYVSDNFYFHFNNIPYEECEIPIIEHITPTNVIGTGMISIVYEGVDKEGKVYVIKAKRKGIDAKVIDGLQQIKNILYWVKWVPYNIFNIDYIFTQFEKSMLDQLSFENEIKNHKIFKKNNEYNSIIVVPTIYEELCTSTQIVMSKIEGTHYSTLPDELISKYAKELIEMTAKNLIMDGFIHSDLHAGNIIFTPDGKLGIIDFGLIMKLNVKERQSFFDILKHFAVHDYESSSNIIIYDFLGPEDAKQKLTPLQLKELQKSLIFKLHEIYDVNKTFTIKDIQYCIQLANKYKLNISNCFYNLMFFVISCECLIKKMSPLYVDIFIEKIKVLTEMEE